MTVVDADLAALDPDFDRHDLSALVARRLSGRFPLDEWGFDRDLLTAVTPLVRARWSLRIEGESALPEIGPALLVHTRRVGLSEPAVLASAVHRVTDRPLRATGYLASIPGPMGPFARRLGAVPSGAADLRSLLRAGELVGLPLGRQLRVPTHVGAVPLASISAALAAGAPIIPVAVMGLEIGRWWTVRFGRPITTRRRRSAATPSAAELAEVTRQRLQSLVTESRR
jgi:1-acyl-sn-glycerol-3-phosphate acyltransferase